MICRNEPAGPAARLLLRDVVLAGGGVSLLVKPVLDCDSLFLVPPCEEPGKGEDREHDAVRDAGEGCGGECESVLWVKGRRERKKNTLHPIL
jgi:hypothetical protein